MARVIARDYIESHGPVKVLDRLAAAASRKILRETLTRARVTLGRTVFDRSRRARLLIMSNEGGGSTWCERGRPLGD